MKKKLLSLTALAFLSMGVVPAHAQTEVSPTATTQVYDLSKFGEEILELFYKADKDGRKYPTQAEFEAAGFNMMDMAFVRSHVRPRSIMVDKTKNVVSKVYDNRKLWMNIPIGIGKIQGGYPSSNFSDDTYTSWNYTNVFGSWNHGIFHVPGVAVDAAHKHGTDIYAGIKFFESWTSGAQAAGWVGKVKEQDPAGYGGYKYVRPLVNAMMFFGQDGLNYNFEDTGYNQYAVINFHQNCYKYAAECGFTNFHIGIYTASSTLTSTNVKGLFGYNNVKTADAFLNYANSNFQTANNIRNSLQEARNAMGTTDGVYQGAWMVSMARSWSNLDTESTRPMGIVLWGEHSQSRLLSYNSGTSSIDFQENYQKLQDRFFSGGNRNPASRPTANNTSDWGTQLKTFQGLAEYIPERTALKQNLPFTTFFSIGNGDRYNYKGKKTLGSWYNLGQQDVMPTYRWLVYDKGTTTAVTDNGSTNDGVPFFTNADAYIGGSALRLTNTKAVDIVLYRAELTVSGANPKATIALKSTTGATDGLVSVIVKKKGESAWLETEFANVKGTTWEDQTVELKGINKDDVIEYIGLRTSGNTKDLLVGQLSLNDDSKVTPAEIKEAVVDVKEECQKSMSVRMRWDVDATAKTREAWGLLYNDEANIDHFEVLYKDGETGRVSEVGRTSSWGAYIGNLPMTDETKPYIGVRSVSVDGKTYSKVYWVEVPRAEKSTLPEVLSANGNYPSIILDNSSDGLNNALTQRFVTQLTITGGDEAFNYTNNEGTPYMVDTNKNVPEKQRDKTNYIFAENNVLKCTQGQTLTLNLSINNGGDGLQYCTATGYIDWDCNEGFDPTTDELVLTCGESNQKKKVTQLADFNETFTVKVPTDAVRGKSRLRLVFSDAWFPHPGATGATNKGFSIDFPVEISGTNPERQPAVDTHDTGVSDIPEGIGGSTDIVSAKSGVSQVAVEGTTLNFQNTDKVWIFSADGVLVKYVNGGVSSINAENFGKGIFLIRMQNGQVMRTTKVVL